MPLPLCPPLQPMLARLERTLPTADGLSYEPKWDGFRCLAFIESGDVELYSRNDRPLTRYFPEVVAALRRLPETVLDGELVIFLDGVADFAALMARLHPAASRVQLLATTTPACYIAFDLLAAGDADLTTSPFAVRRARLGELLATPPAGVALTPQTADPDDAHAWLEAPAGSGIDGVMVKPADLTYEAGRRSMVKVKSLRTADCVVAGVRIHPDGGVGTLLLGVYDDAGVLRHVGIVSSLARSVRADLREHLLPLVTTLEGHPWEQGFALEGGAIGRFKGTAGRWTPDMPRDWVPLSPERVAEVSYDHLEGTRFRHPARLLRWRPDRNPQSCTTEQLR